jgi:hypothetical protein
MYTVMLPDLSMAAPVHALGEYLMIVLQLHWTQLTTPPVLWVWFGTSEVEVESIAPRQPVSSSPVKGPSRRFVLDAWKQYL